MEPLTLATAVTIILTGALTRVGELTLDGSIEQLRKLITVKSPNTLKKLQAAHQNSKLLPETIAVMATLLEEDREIKAVAEKVAEENESNPYVINMIEKVVNLAQGNATINIREQNINL